MFDLWISNYIRSNVNIEGLLLHRRIGFKKQNFPTVVTGALGKILAENFYGQKEDIIIFSASTGAKDTNRKGDE